MIKTELTELPRRRRSYLDAFELSIGEELLLRRGPDYPETLSVASIRSLVHSWAKRSGLHAKTRVCKPDSSGLACDQEHIGLYVLLSRSE